MQNTFSIHIDKGYFCLLWLCLQGMKKIEEIFSLDAKVVDDLLHIAKVFLPSEAGVSD
jgi:hypothetical protein